MSAVWHARWPYAGFALLLATVFLGNLAGRPLFNPDEGRYAEIPREMLASGDWVIPHLNGLAYIEKPPLQYWATAFFYRLFGTHEFAARLYTGLCALGTLAATWNVARAGSDEGSRWRAAALLASMSLFLFLGQLLTLDMSLTFYMTLSLCGFLAAQRAGASRAWMLLAWVATALGVLTKGVIAAAIPSAVLVLYSLSTRDLAPWRRLHLAWGMPLFLVLTVPWHWLAARRDADFLTFFFVHEHVQRYLTPIAQRVEPWWFFGAVFLAGTLPWTCSALRVLVSGWRTRTVPREFNATRFLWLWVVFVLLFFSASDSKLIPYILPALPALALLIAGLPAPVLRRDVRLCAWVSVLAGLAVAAAALELPALLASSHRSEYFVMLARPLEMMAALMFLSGLWVLLQRSPHVTRDAVLMGTGWSLAWLLAVHAAVAVAPIYSGEELAAALPADARDAPVYSVGTYDQSLTFYLQHPVTLVNYRGELDYGLKQQPDAEIDVRQFAQRWQAAPNAYAVMETGTYDKLTQEGIPMHIIGRNADRVVVRP